MAHIGKLLFLTGCGIAVLGALLWGLGTAFPGLKLGRLPGDIAIQQGNTRIYVPITTMILASALITGILWLVGAYRK